MCACTTGIVADLQTCPARKHAPICRTPPVGEILAPDGANSALRPPESWSRRTIMLRRNSHILVKTVRLVSTKAWGETSCHFCRTKSRRLFIFFGFQTCSNCEETVFAAKGADVADDVIRYHWTCDLCGHGFITEADLIYEVAA